VRAMKTFFRRPVSVDIPRTRRKRSRWSREMLAEEEEEEEKKEEGGRQALSAEKRDGGWRTARR